MNWDLDDVTTLGEIADQFGVAKTATCNWARRYPGFPRPLKVIGGYRVYSRAQIVRWRARKFGKPELTAPAEPREVSS